MEQDAKRKLKGLLARIFSDAIVEVKERAELDAYLASGTLTPVEIQEVVQDFVQTTWKITIADGEVTTMERERLREIVRVLALPESALPPAWVDITEI